MSKRVIVGVIAFIGGAQVICWAQQTHGGDFRLDNPALVPGPQNIWNSRPVFSPLSFDWTMPTTPLPTVASSSSQSVNASARTTTSLPDRLADWAPKFDYATGEIGFTYGRATGKFGGDFKEAYILGTAGNDHFQISAGALYQDSNFRWRGR